MHPELFKNYLVSSLPQPHEEMSFLLPILLKSSTLSKGKHWAQVCAVSLCVTVSFVWSLCKLWRANKKAWHSANKSWVQYRFTQHRDFRCLTFPLFSLNSPFCSYSPLTFVLLFFFSFCISFPLFSGIQLLSILSILTQFQLLPSFSVLVLSAFLESYAEWLHELTIPTSKIVLRARADGRGLYLTL